MASSRSRQRKLAREKYQRQMARRAQHQRRRRQVQAGLGVFLTLALVGVGSAWLLGAFDSKPPEHVADACTWIPQETTANPDRIEVGTPDPNPPTTGVRTMTADLDAGEAGTGEVEVVLEVDTAPCAAASLEYLAAEGFYDGTTCHEILDGVALRCGDPSGTGLGGPTYAYFGENQPTAPVAEPAEEESEEEQAEEEESRPPALYQRGTVAVGDITGQHGSQFLVFFDDYATESPLYSIVGTVTGGLDLIDAIGEAGIATDDDGEEVPTGAPTHEVRIQSLTVVDPDADGPENQS